MASFNIFGPATKEGIRVGYISTDRGMVDNVSVRDANIYAKKDPGTVFIYKTRDSDNKLVTNYLNINDVNKLDPTDEDIPVPCEDELELEAPCGPAEAIFMGGCLL